MQKQTPMKRLKEIIENTLMLLGVIIAGLGVGIFYIVVILLAIFLLLALSPVGWIVAIGYFWG